MRTNTFLMRIGILVIGLFLFWPFSASARILVRWSHPSVPAKAALGVRELVIPWSENAPASVQRARKAGFEVYVEVSLKQAAAAEQFASKQAIVAMIVDPGNAAPPEVASVIADIQKSNSKLAILVLDPNGKQPLMRGQTITTLDGVLQVSSPTAQPWLDSNLSLARFDQEFNPKQPPLYSFKWDAGDSLQQSNGGSADDYCLAIAEASAIRADLVLNVDDVLQKGLTNHQSAAWGIWNEVKSCLSFASSTPTSLRPWANVGVVARDYDTAYEPMNLMGRHNIPFRVLRAGMLNAAELQGLNVLVVFASPDDHDADAIQVFARSGRTVVLVDIKGEFPWHSLARTRTAEHAISYAVGKGKIIELSEPVADPETFAQDIRRLISPEQVIINAWNALTTLAIPYENTRNGETVIELLNYAEEALRVQIRVKGLFSSVRYQRPDRSGLQSLKPGHRGGFTEFVIPSLRVAGRVYLTGASKERRGPQSSR